MSDYDRPDETIDPLVRQFLKSQEDQVDGEAFLGRLRSRRRRRRLTRLPLRRALLAAAAGLLVAAGIFVVLHGKRPPASAGPLVAMGAARDALGGAWGAAGNAAAAALSAARDPVHRLSEVRPSVSDAADRAETWLNRALRPPDQSLDRGDDPLSPSTEETES